MANMSGKVVLITGGASGIGAEVARRLHAKGANLILTDLDGAALAETAGRLGGSRVLTVVADVRDAAAMAGAVAQAVDRFGGIDVVLANAGIGSFGSTRNIDPEAFKRVIDVNVTGVFNTVHAALPALVQRRGYVLLVSSLAAFVAGPGMAARQLKRASRNAPHKR